MNNQKKIESEFWDLHAEIRSLSTLLKNIGACQFTDQEIYGLGVMLDKYARSIKNFGTTTFEYIASKEN